MNGKTSTQTDKTSPESLPVLFVTDAECCALIRGEMALRMRLHDLQRCLVGEKDLMACSEGFSGDLSFWESAIAETELAIKTIEAMYNRASVVKAV